VKDKQTIEQLKEELYEIKEHQKQVQYPVTTEWSIAVVQVENSFRYTWQKVTDKNQLIPGTEFTHDICPDYTSPEEDFKIGTILNSMTHTDEGKCWSLHPDKHAGFFKRRDSSKNPIYVAKEAVYVAN
jgi:hypothetical protein